MNQEEIKRQSELARENALKQLATIGTPMAFNLAGKMLGPRLEEQCPHCSQLVMCATHDPGCRFAAYRASLLANVMPDIEIYEDDSWDCLQAQCIKGNVYRKYTGTVIGHIRCIIADWRKTIGI